MAEKNDQKMRERAERAEKFQAKLQELLALAKKKKNNAPAPAKPVAPIIPTFTIIYSPISPKGFLFLHFTTLIRFYHSTAL